jgi:hypothetical protein
MLNDEDVLENVHNTTNGTTITLPNGKTLTSTRGAGYLPLPAELSTSTKKATRCCKFVVLDCPHFDDLLPELILDLYHFCLLGYLCSAFV